MSFNAFPQTKSGFPGKLRYYCPTTRFRIIATILCALLISTIYLRTPSHKKHHHHHQNHAVQNDIRLLHNESQTRFNPRAPFPHYIFHFSTVSSTFTPSTTTLIKTWNSLNPRHNHDLFDNDSANTFVKRHFAKQPSITNTFTDLRDPILRADLFRYLALFKEGGIYSDLDTSCLQPINTWIPTRYKNKVNIVLGVEYDLLGSSGNEISMQDLDILSYLQLATWTMMSKPHHPLFATLISKSVRKLQDKAVEQFGEGDIWGLKMSYEDVLRSTGPTMVTEAVWEYLGERTGVEFGWRNVTGREEPFLVGDVLILPVVAFGRRGKRGGEGEALVQHYFEGKWKDSHPEETDGL